MKVEYSHRVKTVLDELSHFDFIRAGKIAKQADRNPVYLSAAKYYSEYADLFPEDALSGEKRFMAGESFFRPASMKKPQRIMRNLPMIFRPISSLLRLLIRH